MAWWQEMLLWFDAHTTSDLVWIGVGFFAQGLFMMRFVFQWLRSEQAKRSVVPEVFWYFSVAGGVLLLAYSIYRRDPVYMFGQALGLVIYFRNIYFIWFEKKRNRAVEDSGAAVS